MVKKMAVRVVITLLVASIGGFCVNAISDARGRSGNTLDEPKITADYLIYDYSQQLIKDGASLIFGTMEINSVHGNVCDVIIYEKEIIEGDEIIKEPYIIDKSQTYHGYMDEYTRCTYYEEGKSKAKVYPLELFIETSLKNQSEGSNNDYYWFYIMEDQILLVLSCKLGNLQEI